MNQTAEVATATIEKALTEYNIPDATMQALAIFKEAEKLECKDADSRKIIGRHRADIKTLRPQVNTVRIALNKSFAEKNKSLADTIESALNSSFDVFDKKIKDYDSVAEKKAEKKRIYKAKVERDRIGKIQWHMDGLDLDCKPLGHGASKNEIVGAIENLHLSEISAVDFDTRTEEAEQMKETAIANAEAALENKVKLEEEQKAAAELAAKTKADADALEVKTKAFEKKQADAKAEQKKKDDAEAKLTAKADADIKARQDKLDKGEADLKAKKDASDAKEYSDMYDDATRMNSVVVNDSAVSLNEAFDQAKADDEKEEKANLKKDKARAKLIKSDQKKIQKTVNQIDKMISETKPLEYGTDEGGQVIVDLYVRLKESLSLAETAGNDLV